MKVIPAIMPRSRSELEMYAGRFVGLAPVVQIDVMDGIFVPEKTWPYKNGFDKSLIGTLPHTDKIMYEIDLMVDDPEDTFESWIRAGAKRAIVHIESIKSISDIATRFDDTIELGVAVNIETPLEVLFACLEDESCASRISVVQCMGIARIGFQGQPFDAHVINMIRTLRERFPKLIISIDGGINFTTAQQVADAGADRIVSGSTILKSANYAEAIDRLKNISAVS